MGENKDHLFIMEYFLGWWGELIY